MIRRVISTLLFVFGGWMLMSELVVAFLDMEPGAYDNAIMLAVFAIIGGIPLLIAAWVSPGQRWQELGLTVLIASGLALFCAISAVVILTDPGFKPFMPKMPPMPDLKFAPIVGAVNLLAIAGVGWLLYRRQSGRLDQARADGNG
jgi:hypothetical protein